MKSQKIKNIFLVIIEVMVIVLGISMVIFGINDIINKSTSTKDYIKIDAVFENNSFEKDENGNYWINYMYEVNGEKYYITSDYSTKNVPENGSLKTIKYNPEDPNDAIIIGYNIEMMSIVMGLIFIVFTSIILLGSNNKKDKSSMNVKKVKSFIINMFVSFGCFVIGCCFCYIINVESEGYSIADIIKNSSASILGAVLFIVVGIYMFFEALFPKKVRELTFKVYDIYKIENGTYNVIFSDESLEDMSINRFLYKYFIYNTENKEKFDINKMFKVNIYKYGTLFNTVENPKVVRAINLRKFVDEDFEEK